MCSHCRLINDVGTQDPQCLYVSAIFVQLTKWNRVTFQGRKQTWSYIQSEHGIQWEHHSNQPVAFQARLRCWLHLRTFACYLCRWTHKEDPIENVDWMTSHGVMTVRVNLRMMIEYNTYYVLCLLHALSEHDKISINCLCLVEYLTILTFQLNNMSYGIGPLDLLSGAPCSILTVMYWPVLEILSEMFYLYTSSAK